MRYISTRGESQNLQDSSKKSFTEILLGGLAPDGGLYLPESYPLISRAELDQWRQLSYADLAFAVLSKFIDNTMGVNDDLRDTLNYQADPQALYFGTPLEYGAAHQFGRPEINLPERSYLGLSEADQQSVLETLEGYLTADAP